MQRESLNWTGHFIVLASYPQKMKKRPCRGEAGWAGGGGKEDRQVG